MGDKKYYWLRLKNDFFKRHDIKIISSMPNGRDIVLLYIKLMVESVDHEGYLRFSDAIPYTAEMISTITETKPVIVNKALDVLKQFGLVEQMEDGTFFLPKVPELIGSETAWAEKKRRQKDLPKLTNGCVRLNAEMVRFPDGTKHFVDEKRYGGNGMLALDLAECRCEMCGLAGVNLVIHHGNGFSNDINDLYVLCTSCHGKVHGAAGNIPPLVHHRKGDVPAEKEIEKEIDIDTYIQQSFTNIRLNKVFNDYLIYRKVSTDIEKEKIKDKLVKLANCDEDLMIRILEQSMEQGWKGLYPIKKDAKKTKFSNFDERDYGKDQYDAIEKAMGGG